MTEAALLLSEIREICERLDRDDMPSPERLRAVVTGARDIASTLAMDQGRELARAMQGLADASEAFKARLHEQLKSVHSSRRALKGYGNLRTNKQGQRIRKKA